MIVAQVQTLVLTQSSVLASAWPAAFLDPFQSTYSICQDQRKQPHVDVEIFHDGESALDLFHVRFVYVVKLNCDVVRSDRHHGTNGTAYQASVCVNVATCTMPSLVSTHWYQYYITNWKWWTQFHNDSKMPMQYATHTSDGSLQSLDWTGGLDW